MTDWDDLIARAKQAAGGGTHDDWGDRVDGLEVTDDLFQGSYRGEVEDEAYDGHGRRIHLLWDSAGEECWVRGKWSLNAEFDRVQPKVGDTVVIYVGDAWEGKSGVAGFYFGLESEPNAAPLPGQTGGAGGRGDDDPWPPPPPTRSRDLRPARHRASAAPLPRAAATAPSRPADRPKPIGEVIDLDRVRRRDRLGGLIREYELAA